MMSKQVKLTLISLMLVSIVVLPMVGCTFIPQAPSPQPAKGTEVIQEAWDVISRNYVDKTKLDPEKMTQGAIKGMVEALGDPYTSYLDPEAFRLGLTSLQGEFDGIGAQVGIRDNKLTIIAPIPGTPAEKAGIKAGDVILEIEGKSTEGMSVTDAVLAIRGPSGTPVHLRIQHEGDSQPLDLTIIRAKIEVTSVRSDMKGDIAYINIAYFSTHTDDELTPILQDTVKKGAKGIIIDLRNDPGGVLDTVVAVASHFVPAGSVVVSVVDNQGRQTSLKAISQSVTTDLPMVVLVNEFSASGSEVLSGALKDYGRATVAGKKTFGKGSVDQFLQLSDGSAIYLTIARWLTPKGTLIEGKGITPDIELTQEGDAAIQWAIDFLHKK